MLWWVVDNANTLIVILGLLLLGLTAYWWNTRRRNVGIAALATLGMLVLVWVLSLLIVTDRKQLVANLQKLVDDVGADRIDDAMKLFAEDVKVKALGKLSAESRKDLQAKTRATLQQQGLKQFVVWNVDVKKVDRPRAQVTFLVRPAEESKFVSCEADFVLVGDMDWRIQELRVDLPGQGKSP